MFYSSFKFLIYMVGTCQSVGNQTNGQVSYNSNPDYGGLYPVNAIATFSCEEDYFLDSDYNSTTCLDSGNWNQPTPMCTGNKTGVEPVWLPACHCFGHKSILWGHWYPCFGHKSFL